jgi:hypothetical protein
LLHRVRRWLLPIQLHHQGSMLSFKAFILLGLQGSVMAHLGAALWLESQLGCDRANSGD